MIRFWKKKDQPEQKGFLKKLSEGLSLSSNKISTGSALR